jgi:hypothetical protein
MMRSCLAMQHRLISYPRCVRAALVKRMTL